MMQVRPLPQSHRAIPGLPGAEVTARSGVAVPHGADALARWKQKFGIRAGGNSIFTRAPMHTAPVPEYDRTPRHTPDSSAPSRDGNPVPVGQGGSRSPGSSHQQPRSHVPGQPERSPAYRVPDEPKGHMIW